MRITRKRIVKRITYLSKLTGIEFSLYSYDNPTLYKLLIDNNDTYYEFNSGFLHGKEFYAFLGGMIAMLEYKNENN